MSAKAIATRSFSIEVKYVIYAEPSKVFDALTQEAILSQWCDGGGRVGLQAGEAVELFGGWVKGEVVAINKKKLVLSYTWKPSEWDKRTAASLVTYHFSKHAAGTEVTVEHTGFPSQEEADKHYGGWTDYVFEPLNDYFTL